MIAATGWAILEPNPKQKVGLIELPESGKTETQIGTITVWPEAGTYVENGVVVPVPSFKVGDKVAYRKYYSSEVEIEGKKYVGVHLENLIAKVD